MVNNKIIGVRLVKWQLQPSSLTRAPDETNHAYWTLGHQTGFNPWANNSFPTLIWSYSLIMYFIWMCFSVCLHMGFTSIWSLTPLPALGCVVMSKSQTFLWWGCRLLKFTGQASDNWNRMVSEQGFYTQTQHNGQGWTKTSNHLLNQATLSHYSTTQSLKYPHLYFSETAQHDEQGCIFF